MIEALKANPQKLAFAEVYGALQTGVVDGQENSWVEHLHQEILRSAGWYHRKPTIWCLTTLSSLPSSGGEGLDPEIRDQLKTILDEVTKERNALSTEINLQNRAQILEAGGVVRELNDEQRQAWVDAMKPVWDQFKDDIGQDLIDAALASNN